MKLLTLIGGSAMAVTWAQLGGFGHLDDALVLLAAAFSITEVSVTRSMWQFAPHLALGPAIAVKPWAIIFVPALLWPWWRDRSMPEHGQRVVGGLAVTFDVASAAWLPFVLLAPHTLDSLRPTVSIAETSVLGLIGTAGGPGRWIPRAAARPCDPHRPTARAASSPGCGDPGGRRRANRHDPGTALAVRIVTDPGTWNNYTPGLTPGALVLEQLTTRRRWPVLTIVLTLAMTTSAFETHRPFRDGAARLRSPAMVAALVSTALHRSVDASGSCQEQPDAGHRRS